MADGYIDLPVEGGTGGITSINGSTVAAQLIVGGTGISVSSVGGTTTITNTGSSGISGSGTTNFIPVWTGTTALGNSDWKQGPNGELQFQNFASAKGTPASPLIDLVSDGTHGAGEFTDSSFSLWFAAVGKAVGSFDANHFYIYDGVGTTNLLRIATASGNAASFLIYGATAQTGMLFSNGQSPNVEFDLKIGGQLGGENLVIETLAQNNATLPGLVEFESSFAQFLNTMRGQGVALGRVTVRGNTNSVTSFGLASQTVPGTWSFSGATGTGTGTLATQDLAPGDIVATVSAPGTTAFISAIGSNTSITTLTNLSGSGQTLTRFPAIHGWVDHAGTVQAYLDYNGLFNLTSLTASLPVFTDASKNLTSTGIVGVAHGGTGLATLTANNVILGNGTGAPLFVAPGTSGNVLTSNGTTWVSSAPPATGVTSVALALPSSVFSVSGSPVTSTGTLTGAFTNQTANTVFAGPTTGSPATPAFRALVAADLPTSFSKTSVVYQPGGTNSKNIYTSWSALWAAVSTNAGIRQVFFDDSFSAITIPAGTYTGMTGITFSSSPNGSLSPVEVDLANGVVFDDLPSLISVFLSNTGASPVITLTNQTKQWFIDRNSSLGSNGTAELIKIDNSSVFLFLITVSEIQTQSYETFNLVNGAELIVYLEEAANIQNDSVRDDGTGVLLQFAASASSEPGATFSNFTGSISTNILEDSNLIVYTANNYSGTVENGLSTLTCEWDNPTVTTGTTYTIPDGVASANINASGTILTLTIKMPANPNDGQFVFITTDQAITTLTVSANTGQAFVGTPINTLALGGVIRYQWLLATGKWWPK